MEKVSPLYVKESSVEAVAVSDESEELMSDSVEEVSALPLDSDSSDESLFVSASVSATEALSDEDEVLPDAPPQPHKCKHH